MRWSPFLAALQGTPTLKLQMKKGSTIYWNSSSIWETLISEKLSTIIFDDVRLSKSLLCPAQKQLKRKTLDNSAFKTILSHFCVVWGTIYMQVWAAFGFLTYKRCLYWTTSYNQCFLFDFASCSLWQFLTMKLIGKSVFCSMGSF